MSRWPHSLATTWITSPPRWAMALREEQSSSALSQLSACCSTRRRQLLTWSPWRRFVQPACLHRENTVLLIAGYAKESTNWGFAVLGMEKILWMTGFAWGNGTLSAIMLLRTLEGVVALTARGHVPILPLPISTNYFSAKTPRRRGGCLLNPSCIHQE